MLALELAWAVVGTFFLVLLGYAWPRDREFRTPLDVVQDPWFVLVWFVCAGLWITLGSALQPLIAR